MNPVPATWPGTEGELLSAAAFQDELRRITRFRLYPPAGDALLAVVRRIEQNSAHSQSRLLARILAAVTYETGEFRRAEVAALDSATLALVINIMDGYAAGTTTRDDLVRATAAAEAACP